MNRPTDKEIEEKFKILFGEHASMSTFKAGIDFALKYNEEEVVLKVYDIGYEIDMVEICNILEQDNHLWDEYDPSIFEGINWVHDTGDELEFSISLRSEYGLHDEILIFIDDKARVTIGLGDTPWEGGGMEDEIPEAIMSYVTKLKY